MQWIDDLKTTPVYEVATTHLGMQGGRLRTMGPCPACNAERRGTGDPRLPLGSGRDGHGWQCHACNAKGDVVELIAMVTLQRSSAQLQGTDWATLREWAVARRLASPGDDDAPRQGRKPQRGRPPTISTSALLAGRQAGTSGTAEARGDRHREAPQGPDDPPAPAGRFSWAPALADECAAALWADTVPARQAREYLMQHRRLAEGSVRAFGLGVYVQDGQPVLSDAGRPYVTIPLRDKLGQAVNVRFRSVPVVGTCQWCQSPLGCSRHRLDDGTKVPGCKEYRVCTGRPLPLFGVDRLLADTSVPVLVHEGELDVVAMHTYGYTSNVVSGTAGAKTFATKDEWLDAIEPYDAVIGLFDGDKDGDEGWKALADKLGHYRTARATLPCKDAGDCLATAVPASAIERAVQQAEPMHGLAFRKVDEFQVKLETLIDHPERLRGTSTGSSKLDQLMGGWRPGVVVVTGETGTGKTTFATWSMLMQARQGHGALITSFEQEPLGTVQKLLRVQVGKDFTQVTREERADALGILGRLPLHILDHYGHLPPARLIEAIRYAKRRLGVRFFLVDHLGFLIPDEAEDERRAIEAVVRALALVAKQMEVTIFLIVHPRNDGPQPGGKYNRVTMKSIKGASAIRQDADDVLVVVAEGPDTAKGKRVKRPWPQSRIYADKVRSEFGVSGGDVALAYDPGSCTYADEWAETPAGRAGLLVPRRVAPKEKPDPPADDGDDKPRRRPPRGGATGKDAAAGEGRQEQLLRPPGDGDVGPEPEPDF